MANLRPAQICAIILGIVAFFMILTAIIIPMVASHKAKDYKDSFGKMGTAGSPLAVPQNGKTSQNTVQASPQWSDYRYDNPNNATGVRLSLDFTNGPISLSGVSFRYTTDKRAPDHANFTSHTVVFNRLGEANATVDFYGCTGSSYISLWAETTISFTLNVYRNDSTGDGCETDLGLLNAVVGVGGIIFGVAVGVPGVCCVLCALVMFFCCAARRDHYTYYEHHDQAPLHHGGHHNYH